MEKVEKQGKPWIFLVFWGGKHCGFLGKSEEKAMRRPKIRDWNKRRSLFFCPQGLFSHIFQENARGAASLIGPFSALGKVYPRFPQKGYPRAVERGKAEDIMILWEERKSYAKVIHGFWRVIPNECSFGECGRGFLFPKRKGFLESGGDKKEEKNKMNPQQVFLGWVWEGLSFSEKKGILIVRGR